MHWIINPNQDGVYQDKLDEALGNQLSAADDDKVDIFAAEECVVSLCLELLRRRLHGIPVCCLLADLYWVICAKHLLCDIAAVYKYTRTLVHSNELQLKGICIPVPGMGH